MTDELTRLDAVAQAELARRKEVTPLELVEAAIARIEKLNPSVNAVVLPALERARDEAARASRDGSFLERPFAGVPMLMKDLGGQEANAPAYLGMKCLKRAGWIEPESSHFAARLQQAGFVSLGRTNTPELGLLPTTEPEIFGPTRNPWSLEHSPGGSSGGAAAAVACGMVPAAHASDGGGSIRIPASHCGLVGLKPTRGRSSFGPGAGERWSGFSCELVVSRTVRDTAAVLDVVSGAMPGDPYFAPPPKRLFTSEVGPIPGACASGWSMDRRARACAWIPSAPRRRARPRARSRASVTASSPPRPRPTATPGAARPTSPWCRATWPARSTRSARSSAACSRRTTSSR